MADSPRISLDSDGTLLLGSASPTGKLAPVRTGTRRFLQALRNRGFRVAIHTAHQPIAAVREHYRAAGLMPLIEEISNTKLPSKIYLDDRGITFTGSYDDTLKAIDEFRPHWEEDSEHKLSCVMAPLPEEIASKIRSLGTALPDDDLDPEDGREKDIHLTLKYGLESDSPDGARRALAKVKPIRIKLTKLGMFKIPQRRDVLIFEVESKDAVAAHDAICKECPHVDTYASYQPHVTVAYLKPGKAKSHLWPTDLDGSDVTLTRAVFADRNGNQESILLAG